MAARTRGRAAPGESKEHIDWRRAERNDPIVAYRDDLVAARRQVAELEHEVEQSSAEKTRLERERKRLRRALARRRPELATREPAMQLLSVEARERSLGTVTTGELQVRGALLAARLGALSPSVIKLRGEVERLRTRLTSGAPLRASWHWPVWSCLLAGMLIAAPVYLLGYTIFVWILGRMLY